MSNQTVLVGTELIPKLLIDLYNNATEYGDAVVSAFASENLKPTTGVSAHALTVNATVGGVQLPALNATTTHVVWDNQTAEIRVTFDGSAPTSTTGHLIEPGDTGVWSAALAAAAKFICTGSVSATIYATEMMPS